MHTEISHVSYCIVHGFLSTWARDPQEKGAGMRDNNYSYMLVTKGYTAGDNKLHDSTMTAQQELARTYYNENIST